MILLDDRTGSVELYPHFKKYGLPVELCRLDIADVRWVGNGPEGDVDIGVERKAITDLVACIRDKRLSGFQLIGTDDHPGLLESFDYVYLMIDGLYRPGDGGVLEHWGVLSNGEKGWKPLYIGSKAMLYLEMDSFLASLELRAVTRIGEPVRVHRAVNVQETAAKIATLFNNWTGKRWDQHKAHQDIYTRVPKGPARKKASFVKPNITLAVAMMAQIDHLHEKALEAGKLFKTPRQFFEASEKKWKQIDGIGAKMAKQIRKDLGYGS